MSAEGVGHRELLPSLAGMRFLAAITVFLAHAALQVPFADERVGGYFLFVTTPIGFAAVSYFFMLSGFVLTWTRRPGDTTTAFFRRRFSRVLPSHFVALLAAVVLALATGTAVGLPQVLFQALLLQSWIPNIGYIDVLNSLTWTMSVEVFFYLMFPLLLPLLNRIRPERLWVWVIGAFSFIIALPFAVAAWVPNSGTEHPLSGISLLPFLNALSSPDQPLVAWGSASYTQVWFVFHFPLARLADFTIGVLLARIVLSGRWIGIRPRTAVALLLPAWGAAMFVPFLFRLNCVTIIPMALLLGAVAARDVSGRRSRLGSPPMVVLGNLTYGFYLVHGLVLAYGHLALGTTMTEDGPELKSFGFLEVSGLLLIGFTLSLAIAWVFYRFIETPSTRRWGAGRATRQPQQSAMSPAERTASRAAGAAGPADERD